MSDRQSLSPDLTFNPILFLYFSVFLRVILCSFYSEPNCPEIMLALALSLLTENVKVEAKVITRAFASRMEEAGN